MSEERLWKLLTHIQTEFQALRQENELLKRRLREYEGDEAETSVFLDASAPQDPAGEGRKTGKLRMKHSVKAAYTGTKDKIVQSVFRHTDSNITASLLRRYHGHADGIWDVACSSEGVVATGSADYTARIWNDAGLCTTAFLCMSSVNAVRFHPLDPTLLASACGDGAVRIWQVPQNTTPLESRQICDDKSEDDYDPIVSRLNSEQAPTISNVRDPREIFKEHTGPVAAAVWMYDGASLVSGSWDHSAKLWDVETGKVIHTFRGHDMEITNVTTHPSAKLVVTSSRDSTFRLWDFRQASIHEVNMYQGHSDSVSTVVLTERGNLISGSDDRTVKIWDLRKMKTAKATIRTDSGVNRLSVSPRHEMLAVPLDNGHINVYDLAQGVRMFRIRKRNKGHRRTATSVIFGSEEHMYSSGFDGVVMEWSLRQIQRKSSRKEMAPMQRREKG